MVANHSAGMTLSRTLQFRSLCLGLVLCLTSTAAALTHAETRRVSAGDTDIGMEVYPAKGKLLLIWQSHEVGIQGGDQALAQQLAEHGIETWLLDVLEAYFLPNTASSMDRIPAAAMAAMIQAASKTGKRIIVASSGRGVIPVLRGIRQWQILHADNSQLLGTILLSPKLFVETPDPGLAGRLMPIAYATNQTIVLMQPDKSPWYWKLEQTLAALRQGGSDVYLWPLPGMRDRFYFRPDASDDEKHLGDRLTELLLRAATLLLNNGKVNRHAVAQLQAAPVVPEGKKDHQLAAYRGDPQPPPLRLSTLQGNVIDLADLKGQVVLVNFWATWCPPCVHEMPSMQRLADGFKGQAFTILGVNMAEDAATIRAFLQQRVHIDFPIVLDRDGRALKAWRVFAFPTSYVLDKHGRIRYALFGSVDWDTEEIKHILLKLMAE
jgi:thiol-disulfide isomerase/thioredoxin